MLLFGTPHNGLVIDDLRMMIDKDDYERGLILNQLKEGSEYLENQKEELVRIWRGFKGKVVSFYETEKTKQVTVICPTPRSRQD